MGSNFSSSAWVPASWKGIRPARSDAEHRRVVIDAEHADPAIGEGQRQRQPDAAEADDRD